ncbi:hypothetical protein CDAR_273231 [Caerostris darwini]|uniref:Uncharacterized protein n=1 Tax=Caerostris darwini TaxID=1538125 RepID=A0AAV4SMA1_9ARAC|nr:hypothetical protein CDAR_273231 [Caerostris darwini]
MSEIAEAVRMWENGCEASARELGCECSVQDGAAFAEFVQDLSSWRRHGSSRRNKITVQSFGRSRWFSTKENEL